MKDLVKGVNEGAQALEEEDSFTASLEQKASTSESKLMALLEEVTIYLFVCLFTKHSSIRCVCCKEIVSNNDSVCIFSELTLLRV